MNGLLNEVPKAVSKIFLTIQFYERVTNSIVVSSNYTEVKNEKKHFVDANILMLNDITPNNQMMLCQTMFGQMMLRYTT